jgi:hypothetical protein
VNNTEPRTLVAISCAARVGEPYYFDVNAIGKPGISTGIKYESVWARSENIRCVCHPPTALPDDPDADALDDNKAIPNGRYY